MGRLRLAGRRRRHPAALAASACRSAGVFARSRLRIWRARPSGRGPLAVDPMRPGRPGPARGGGRRAQRERARPPERRSAARARLPRARPRTIRLGAVQRPGAHRPARDPLPARGRPRARRRSSRRDHPRSVRGRARAWAHRARPRGKGREARRLCAACRPGGHRPCRRRGLRAGRDGIRGAAALPAVRRFGRSRSLPSSLPSRGVAAAHRAGPSAGVPRRVWSSPTSP